MSILKAGLCVDVENRPLQSDFSKPCQATIKPKQFHEFDQVRTDNYYWLKNKEDPKVLDYIQCEQKYTDEVMQSTKPLQEKIYQEILGRIKQTDESYPELDNGYYYYHKTLADKQYPVYFRKAKGGQHEEVLFDVNQLASGHQAFIFSGYDVSPDNTKIAYFYNTTGSYAEFTLKIKDLTTGKDLDWSVDGVSSFAWGADSQTVLYTVIDKALRPYQVWMQKLGQSERQKLYEETDKKFNVSVSSSKTKKTLFISSHSSTTSEERILSSADPAHTMQLFLPRQKDVEYSVFDHQQDFIVQYKDKAHLNSMIYVVPKQDFHNRASWKLLVPHNSKVLIEGIDVLQDYLILQLREDGLTQIQAIHLSNTEQATSVATVKFPESVYSVDLVGNPEFNADTFRYTYTSLNRPTSLYEYRLTQKDSHLLKQQEVPSGFNPDDYQVERRWVVSYDGTKVPMALVYKKGHLLNGTMPALLYGYGSYGINSDVFFSPSMYSLIDRGFVFAIAQIRGGSELGEQWYEDGKMLHKKNSFHDFIACAEDLIQAGYTSKQRLSIMGGSAGGLLMGAVSNMRPDLFHTVIAKVPFVDIVTTMLDDSLPLTAGEYEEWGNPNDKPYYEYMLSYSPYDNVKVANYPNMLITGGINDSQVLFHEPLKWLAKLRVDKTDNNLLLLHMDMSSGHGGATGRYDGIREKAFDLAFILYTLGIKQ